MRGAFILLAIAVTLAGCTTPEASRLDPQSEQEAVDEAPPTFSFSRSGLILIRPATAPSEPFYSGDAPYFYLIIPEGAEALDLHLEWTIPSEMGLEAHPPEGERITSWDSLTDRTFVPPIEMHIEKPQAGQWYIAAGPRIIGGPVFWSLDVKTTAPSEPEVQEET